MKIVATMSLQAVDRLTAGTPHARANYENSGHYVIASSRQRKRLLLEQCTLMPINMFIVATNIIAS